MKIIGLKKASFYKVFGQTMNLARPTLEVEDAEFAKLEKDIKNGLIYEVTAKKAEPVKVEEVKEEKIVEEVIEKEHVEQAEELKTELEKSTGRGRKKASE